MIPFPLASNFDCLEEGIARRLNYRGHSFDSNLETVGDAHL
jgi:hypothetical protein